MSALRQELLTGLAPVAFAHTALRFQPDPVQQSILHAQARRGIICCSRQWGKSTICALKAVHHAWTHPDSLTLAISPVERQSAEFIRKAAAFLRSLGIARRGDGDNHLSLLLPNGARIVGLPAAERTIRGYSAVSLMFIDEAARVDDNTYEFALPMLAVSRGALWLLSTPFGRRGFFWKEWAHGDADWHRTAVPATECPRIPTAFLEERRRNSPARLFGQEFLCEFNDGLELLFPRHLLERALTDGYGPLEYRA